jgi:hypothetical protein
VYYHFAVPRTARFHPIEHQAKRRQYQPPSLDRLGTVQQEHRHGESGSECRDLQNASSCDNLLVRDALAHHAVNEGVKAVAFIMRGKLEAPKGLVGHFRSFLLWRFSATSS